ncbi:hypothetical protein O181_041147 [Austropuccinia psidii MF-1]|uniref:RNA helicase n=1 Tax=Austropuccinia psidii MF-1 TaxID=1389203 RepID=A0A9Q3HEK3_9BASI|nr:hypothetical protein [Austropuccinia psidii MF-1]
MSFWKPGTLAPGSTLDRAAERAPGPVLTSTPGLKLPILAHRDSLLYAIEKFPFTILVGPTGSGKSTQLPQYLKQAGWTLEGRQVAICEPRRVAATSLASRVASEAGWVLGEEVGYAIRFEELTSTQTRIKYLTDGMLFRELLLDPILSRYSVVIVDEAHERSCYTDLLLGVLKKIHAVRKDLRVVVCSATLDAEKLRDYYNYQPPNADDGQVRATIISIEGRMYPVEIAYLDQPTENYISASVNTVMNLHLSQPRGDILVFLTGKEEIDEACAQLLEKFQQLPQRGLEMSIIPFHAALPPEEQLWAFQPARNRDARKIIVATNIAEASVTIDGIKYVIDSGLVKLRKFDVSQGMDVLTVCAISKASAIQRTGRAGRTSPGKCFRLYTEAAYDNLAQQTEPEICRTELSTVFLQLKALGIENVVKGFEFVDPPCSLLVERALEFLFALGAIDDSGQLTTDLGLKMAEMPVDPMMAKILLESEKFGCSEEIVTIAAMTSVQNAFVIGESDDLLLSHRNFIAAEGDHFTYLNVFNSFIRDGKSSAKWCAKHHLNFKALSRAVNIRGQLMKYLKKFGIGIVSCGTDEKRIRRCLVSGYFKNVAWMKDDGSYRSCREGNILFVHPSSVMFNRKPQTGFVIFHEITETKKKFMKDLTVIEKDWLTELAGHYYNFKGVKQ